MKQYIKNAHLVSDGAVLKERGVVVENGVISALSDQAPEDAEVLDLKGKTLAPAFIDLHCHGGDGFEFIDGTKESVLGACRLHAQHGTGILYPTISAADYETTYRALECLEQVKDQAELVIPGVHLEGPYLSPEMCGAQDPGIIRKPNEKEYKALFERFGHLIARWDYAPEEDEDCRFVSFLQEKGIVSATAHSAAQWKHLVPAMEKGNRLVTHLYSCTSTVVREGGFRKLGIIETAFLYDEMFVEAIGDGCHLPKELIQMIFRIKGADRICLITDAIRFAGMGGGGETWKGAIPYVVEDGVAKLKDRSAFAGSIATTDVLFRKGVEMGFSVEDTVTMLTRTPARVMGLDSFGSISPGKKALFAVIDEEFNVKTLSLM